MSTPSLRLRSSDTQLPCLVQSSWDMTEFKKSWPDVLGILEGFQDEPLANPLPKAQMEQSAEQDLGICTSTFGIIRVCLKIGNQPANVYTMILSAFSMLNVLLVSCCNFDSLTMSS